MFKQIKYILIIGFIAMIQISVSGQKNILKMDKVIYVMDPHCGWCFGNSDNINEVFNQLGDSLQFEILVGGMWVGDDAPFGGPVLTRFLGQHAPQMANAIEVHLDQNYYELAMDSSYQFSSLEPSAAIVLIKQIAPKKAFVFASEVQKSLFVKGQKLDVLATYLPILSQLGIDQNVFKNSWLSAENLANTNDEFTRTNELTSGYPSLLRQKNGETSLLASGYLEKNEMVQLLKP